LFKGILQKNPPLPKYQFSWDLDLVLKYLQKLPANKNIPLKLLGKKLAILLALAAPKRVSEIARLDRRFMSKANNMVKFSLPGLSKTQKDCQNRTVEYKKFHKKRKNELCRFSTIDDEYGQ